MKRFALLLAALIASTTLHAQTTTISALPAAGALTSADALPVDQTGCATPATCKTTPAAITTYVNANAVIPLATGVSGNLPIANNSSIVTNTVLGNNSGSTGAPQALDPLALQVLQNNATTVIVVSTTNITLSGLQTVDGVALAANNRVMVNGQSTTSQNGLYRVASGAWTRDIGFPAGDVIPGNCVMLFYVAEGTANSGQTYILAQSTSITVGTTGFNFTAVSLNASTTKHGLLLASNTPTGTDAAVIFTGTAPTAGTNTECASVSGTTPFNLVDHGDANGNRGECALTNGSTGHIIITNGGFPPSASAGTLNANSTDHWGFVTGLSGATTLTITFGTAYPAVGGVQAASCTANDSAGTAVGVTYTVASGVTSAAIFTMSALTGSLSFHCFGAN